MTLEELASHIGMDVREIRKLGYQPHVMRGVERIVIGAIGDEKIRSGLA